jgi:acyl-CoA thioester hydrolase
MSRPRIHVHTSTQPLRWADMDMQGHVNNTVYFRYMEQARIEWFYQSTLAGGGFADGQGSVIVNASCHFLAPLVYPGTIEVHMALGDLGRTSVGSFYEIVMGGRKYADGAAKIVWIDLASGRPTPLPERIALLLREPHA